jgi:hypothetical protein
LALRKIPNLLFYLNIIFIKEIPCKEFCDCVV